MTEDELVKIRILDREYSILSAEKEKVLRVAEYLNGQIDRIKAASPVLNRIDISVQAAFKAASDYFEVQEELERLKADVETKASRLASRIENNLTGPGNQGP